MGIPSLVETNVAVTVTLRAGVSRQLYVTYGVALSWPLMAGLDGSYSLGYAGTSTTGWTLWCKREELLGSMKEEEES